MSTDNKNIRNKIYETRWERRALLAIGIGSGIGSLYHPIFLAPLAASAIGYASIYVIAHYVDKEQQMKSLSHTVQSI